MLREAAGTARSSLWRSRLCFSRSSRARWSKTAKSTSLPGWTFLVTLSRATARSSGGTSGTMKLSIFDSPLSGARRVLRLAS
jgi:hypothetical protein